MLVYLCDDEEIWPYLGRQMAADGSVDLAVTAGNLRGTDEVTVGEEITLDLMIADDDVTGDLTIAGEQPRPVVALPPREGSNAGLVMASTAESAAAHQPGWAWAAPRYVGGWIILVSEYRVRGAVTLDTAVAPVDDHLESTTVPLSR